MISPRNKAIESLRLDAKSTIEGYEFIRRNSMSSKNESDTIARLALGLIIFLVMRYAPRAVEWWNKRNRQEGT